MIHILMKKLLQRRLQSSGMIHILMKRLLQRPVQDIDKIK